MKAAQRRRNANEIGIPITRIASTVDEVHNAYLLTEEAMTLLHTFNQTTEMTTDNEASSSSSRSYPPLYGMDSNPWDDTTIVASDDDEWLYVPAQDWTVENLIHAEQVLRKLLDVKRWGTIRHKNDNANVHDEGKNCNDNITNDHAPTLRQIAQSIDQYDTLRAVYDMVSGSTEIVRAKSAIDPNGKNSYQMRLCIENFPVLNLLHDRRSKMFQRGAKEFDKDVVEIQSEISSTIQQIITDLGQKILSVSEEIQMGLDLISHLDVVIAKAAYGLKFNGKIPTVQNNGMISVKQFIHPVLMGQAADPNNVVPIDLQLSAVGNDQRALIISGANGGGKTAALKSFGLVSIMTKLGIPIPVRDSQSNNNDPPRVDYFDQVIANIGDRQNLIDGESTWTSIVNSCAKTINRLTDFRTGPGETNPAWLVLLDEFGSGTDPEAGGAIAQAVLEEILSVPACSVVATTHSPRLKSLSFDDPSYGCASVLLQETIEDDDLESVTGELRFKRPCFKLEYGIIGESYALGAAARSRPPLPSRVLARAFALLSESAEDGEDGSKGQYILALTKSMEKQLERHRITSQDLENSLANARECQRATMALAGSFQTYIDRVDGRLEDIYRKLKGSTNPAEIIGDTIAQVRVVKKDVLSQKEKLASQGLRMVPIERVLRPGDSVVIVSEVSKWDGISAQIVADASTDSTLKPTEVLVQPSFSMEAWSWEGDDAKNDFDPIKDRYLIVPRYELAEWCPVDIEFEPNTSTSVSDSKQKLNSLLSSLNSVSSSTNGKDNFGKKKISNSSFRSSRERKASKRKRK
jgi:DNA mismatch repair protein MutS2